MDPDNVPGRPQDTPRPPTGDELALRRRVSDLEREDVAEILREAAGEGRLTFTELEDRLESVYAARTYGELVELTSDLPNGPSHPSASHPSAGQFSAGQAVSPAPSQGLVEAAPTINVFLSESKRTGNWIAPQRQDINAVLGDVTLDYTEAQLPYDEVYIDVKSILADVKIRVPQNAIVHLDSQPILGSVTEQGSHDPNAQPGARPKVFHIRGTAILGEIKVKRGPRLTKRLGLP